MRQATFASVGFERYGKTTRRAALLAEMERAVPWAELWWRLHREWFERSVLADLLGADFSLAEIHKLYACHDHLLAHKPALFDHLVERWRDLFNASFDVLLYDLTIPTSKPSRHFRRATSAVMATRATGGRTVCRWSLRW